MLLRNDGRSDFRRDSAVGMCTILLLLSADSVWGETPPLQAVLSPPDAAVVVGNAGRLTLSWPGTAKEYYVQVHTAGKPYFEAQVKGNSVSMELRPGLSYRWNVAPVTSGLAGLPEEHAFSLAAQSVFSFDGPRGASPPSSQPRAGILGLPGSPGGPGQTVKIKVHPPVADLTCLELEGDRLRQKVYFLAGSSPITVTARGGDGGEGGSGGPGAVKYLYNGYYDADAHNGFNGADGGSGGDGGPGGRIVIESLGRPLSKEWSKIIRPVVDGGQAGQGGLGGEGGPAPTFPANSGRNGSYTHFAGRPGLAGKRGQAGRTGVQGSIESI